MPTISGRFSPLINFESHSLINFRPHFRRLTWKNPYFEPVLFMDFAPITHWYQNSSINWSNMYWWTHQGQWWHFQLDYRWRRLTSAKQSPMDPRCTRSLTTNTTRSPWSYCFRAFQTEPYSRQHSPRICMAEDARIHPTLLPIMYSMRSKQIAETSPLWFAKASPYSRSTLGFNLHRFHWTTT